MIAISSIDLSEFVLSKFFITLVEL